MPQLSAASSREHPSSTSAMASNRRTTQASRVRDASWRRSDAARSNLVIATAIPAPESAPDENSESQSHGKWDHIRVNGPGRWYYMLDVVFFCSNKRL